MGEYRAVCKRAQRGPCERLHFGGYFPMMARSDRCCHSSLDEYTLLLPGVPTLMESGLLDYEMPAWRSIMGPAGMWAETVEILNRAMVRALASNDLREQLASIGSVPSSSTPDELRKRYADWSVLFGRIAKTAGLKPA